MGGACEFVQVRSREEMAGVLELGTLCRSTASTSMNNRWARRADTHHEKGICAALHATARYDPKPHCRQGKESISEVTASDSSCLFDALAVISC